MSKRCILCLSILVATSCGGSAGTGPSDDPGPVAAVNVASGGGQIAPPQTPMPDSVVAEVTDSAGNPIPGVLVNFEIPAGEEAGSFDAGALQTNDQGRVFAELTAGTRAWTTRVEAGEDSAYTARLVASREGRADVIDTLVFAVNHGEPVEYRVEEQSTADRWHGDTISVKPLITRVTDEFGNLVPLEKIRSRDASKVDWIWRDAFASSSASGPSGSGWEAVIDTAAFKEQGYQVGETPAMCSDGRDVTLREYEVRLDVSLAGLQAASDAASKARFTVDLNAPCN